MASGASTEALAVKFDTHDKEGAANSMQCRERMLLLLVHVCIRVSE
jgi:hypothetical protein